MRIKDSKYKFVSIVLIAFFVFGLFSFYTFETASAYNGTITYDSGTNTITCVGGSSSTPISFNDIFEADLADTAWNVTEKQGTNQFLFNAKIIFGDGSTATYFADTNKQILFSCYNFSLSNNEIIIHIKNNAHFTLGEIINNDYKTTTNGCIISVIFNDTYYSAIIKNDINSDPNFYSCFFTAYRLSGNKNAVLFIQYYVNNVYNCKLENTRFQYSSGSNFYNIYSDLNLPNAGLFVSIGENNTYDKIIMVKGDNLLASSYGLSPVIYNSIIYNTTYIFKASNIGSNNIYLIDCISDNWVFDFGSYATYGKVLRQYTFNLNVLNGEITDFVKNATVSIYKDGSLIYSGLTNSSGMIPTQTLTYGYYEQPTGNTIQNASSPYYLVITHPDWQTYISRFYITEPLRLTVSMQEPTVTGYTEVQKSDYTTIILFVISLILCIIGLALTVPLLPLIALTVSVINVLLLTEISMFNILLIILNIIFTVITIVRTKTKNN